MDTAQCDTIPSYYFSKKIVVLALGEVHSLISSYLSALKRRKLCEILNGERKVRSCSENKWWNARPEFTSNTFPPETPRIFVNTTASLRNRRPRFGVLNTVLLAVCSYFKNIENKC